MSLAYGVLRDGGLCARIGDRVVDLGAVAGSLDELMARGPAAWEEVRGRAEEAPELDAPELAMPFTVADYVDFYSSIHHASNVGRMFGREQPLLSNWRHLPGG
jgi:fumarylacetoacetase